jgi:elongator complex protein 3
MGNCNEKEIRKKVACEIAEKIISACARSPDDINRIKKESAQKNDFSGFMTNIEILSSIPKEQSEKLREILAVKPARSQSGISVIAAMTKPMKCPHGKCAYCPGGPGSEFGETPQSYTGREPATMRGMRAGFDPYIQVMNRLEQYVSAGHIPEKVELIVMGGTFPSFPEEYQKEFVGYCLKAMNDFSSIFYKKGKINLDLFREFFEMPSDIKNPERTEKILKKLANIKGKLSLETEQEKNETSSIRCIAMCLETRPDFCFEPHINEMLSLGTTRVELGAQTVYDDILKKIERGHSVADTIRATALLKDSFLKVGYHMMPGLPGSSRGRDINAFREIFENPDFKPDNLKIYPCMVIKGTKLHEMWKKNEYAPLSAEFAADIITEAKKYIPEYCRVMRVQRDIPTKFTEAGVEMTNLRQYVGSMLKEKGIKCRCIRCREPKLSEPDFENIRIKKTEYKASKGTEIFISAEDSKKDLIFGFARLRIPDVPFRKEILPESAGIRELHVYGKAVPIGERDESAGQHRGIGKMLMQEAEKTASEEFLRKHMYVISGIGAREYYKKLGYRRTGAYMEKEL